MCYCIKVMLKFIFIFDYCIWFLILRNIVMLMIFVFNSLNILYLRLIFIIKFLIYISNVKVEIVYILSVLEYF